jgi:hypothetical protein
MSETQLADGLVIIVLRIRDVDVREQIINRLCETGDQITSLVYELNTADWDPGLWDQEVQYLESLLEGTRDSLLVWRFAGQTYSRFTIRGAA